MFELNVLFKKNMSMINTFLELELIWERGIQGCFSSILKYFFIFFLSFFYLSNFNAFCIDLSRLKVFVQGLNHKGYQLTVNYQMNMTIQIAKQKFRLVTTDVLAE